MKATHFLYVYPCKKFIQPGEHIGLPGDLELLFEENPEDFWFEAYFPQKKENATCKRGEPIRRFASAIKKQVRKYERLHTTNNKKARIKINLMQHASYEGESGRYPKLYFRYEELSDEEFRKLSKKLRKYTKRKS